MTLTTDRSSYHVGQPVHMTLVEKNTTGHDVTIEDGPSVDGVFVTKGRATVWRSNAGFQPHFIVLKTLHPGQRFVLSATWYGRANEGRPGMPTGVLVVHSQVAGANTVTIRVRP